MELSWNKPDFSLSQSWGMEGSECLRLHRSESSKLGTLALASICKSCAVSYMIGFGHMLVSLTLRGNR